MTQKKKPAKKVVWKKKRVPYGAWETHDGKVLVTLDDVTGNYGSVRHLPRDQAMIFAFQILRSCSGLSDAEIVKAFKR